MYTNKVCLVRSKRKHLYSTYLVNKLYSQETVLTVYGKFTADKYIVHFQFQEFFYERVAIQWGLNVKTAFFVLT